MQCLRFETAIILSSTIRSDKTLFCNVYEFSWCSRFVILVNWRASRVRFSRNLLILSVCCCYFIHLGVVVATLYLKINGCFVYCQCEFLDEGMRLYQCGEYFWISVGIGFPLDNHSIFIYTLFSLILMYNDDIVWAIHQIWLYFL